ncbi:hypothetical protein CTI12_AA565450 [Artemisia annua]|uniref:Uncharacterized protein n=1 Tax=Artemisia annua TaxID=35608 RepID=A0A2U1KTT2_ARTAN|nr:hypothetical protein CTI12_AA565450 [Artemisia annua]
MVAAASIQVQEYQYSNDREYLLLTGAWLNGAEMLALGLGTHFIPTQMLPVLSISFSTADGHCQRCADACSYLSAITSYKVAGSSGDAQKLLDNPSTTQHLHERDMAIMELQRTFDDKEKELHANKPDHEALCAMFISFFFIYMKQHLHERDMAIMELQRTFDDKEKELHANKPDHEAEHFLLVQNKELASFRREHDTSEAKRAQRLQKIHDLQENVQEKEPIFYISVCLW